MNAQTEEKQPGNGQAVKELYEWMESIILGVITVLLIFTFFARVVTVSGRSMVPTLHDGERLVLQQIGYHKPAYGDIVAVDRTAKGDVVLIKRIVGQEGDTIDIDFEKGEVRRNGELLEEPYINEPTMRSFDVEFPVTVPKGHVFVMGDNRNHSDDSRLAEIGMVDIRQLMGKAVFRYWPVSEIGGVA